MAENKDELVMYILVNKDIGMGKGKVAAQCCHAACIYTYRNRDNPLLERWYHYIQKKIVLKAPQELLEKLEAEGHIAIRDKGYTQIEPNSLTVVTLGVTTREAVEDIVKGLQLL